MAGQANRRQRKDGQFVKHRGLGTNTEKLAQEIAGLNSLQDRDLKARWRSLYGTEPPSRISRDLLIRAVAHRMQEKALGGLKPSTRRLLAKVAVFPDRTSWTDGSD